MKLVPIFVSLTALLGMPSFSAGQPTCGPAAVVATVELAGPDLSLADLLGPSACPALVRAAARLRIGSAPLAGSTRVLEGGEVRALLERVVLNNGSGGVDSVQVPERITVRRAGRHTSDAEIAEQVRAALPAGQVLSPGEIECRACSRIPHDSPVQFVRSSWNPALGSWEISARCVHPADCVPFLVQVRGHAPLPEMEESISAFRGPGARLETAGAARQPRGARLLGEAKPAVRAGETVFLAWDEAGILVTLPVVCLEPGAIGEKVRARLPRAGRVVQAVVVGPGELREAW